MIRLQDFLDEDGGLSKPLDLNLGTQLWDHDWTDPDGQRWQTRCSGVSHYEFDHDNLLNAGGQILRDGEDMGHFNRLIEINMDGEIEIVHDRVLVYEQGQGFGRAWTLACAERYREAGFDKVRVNVAQEGLLVWPKLGYDLNCEPPVQGPGYPNSEYARLMRGHLLDWASQLEMHVTDQDQYVIDGLYAAAYRPSGPPTLHEFITSDLVDEPGLREVLCTVDMQLSASVETLIAVLRPAMEDLSQLPASSQADDQINRDLFND